MMLWVVSLSKVLVLPSPTNGRNAGLFVFGFFFLERHGCNGDGAEDG